jgi:predicted DCC family thiol-disulfide oxidoreductase YuxK
MATAKPLVLYDGFCALCDRSVSFMQARQRPGTLEYAAQHSARGQRVLGALGLAELASDMVILVEGERVSVRSAAALRAFRYLRFPWPLLSIFLVVPAFLRDPVYNLVAHNRYRWFGRLPRE